MGNNCCTAPIENQKSEFDKGLAPIQKSATGGDDADAEEAPDTQSERQRTKKKKIKLGPKSLPKAKEPPKSTIVSPADESLKMSSTQNRLR